MSSQRARGFLFCFGLVIATLANRYLTFFFKTGGFPLSTFRPCAEESGERSPRGDAGHIFAGDPRFERRLAYKLEKGCENVDGKVPIPRIIHQTYKSNKLPQHWASTPAAWKRAHPGWEYRLWTDIDNRKLIEDSYPWFLETYDSYKDGITRADAVRYFILHHYGGVYADLDIQPRFSVEALIGHAEVVLPITPNVGLTNAFMASSKGSKFFEFATKSLKSYSKRWYYFLRHLRIIKSAGPLFIWNVYDDYKAAGNDGLEISLVPPVVLGKCSLCKGPTSCVTELAQLKHLHGDSWHALDSWFFSYILNCYPIIVGYLVISAAFLLVSARGTPPTIATKKGND